mgnify:CR=1 FL=1
MLSLILVEICGIESENERQFLDFFSKRVIIKIQKDLFDVFILHHGSTEIAPPVCYYYCRKAV